MAIAEIAFSICEFPCHTRFPLDRSEPNNRFPNLLSVSANILNRCRPNLSRNPRKTFDSAQTFDNTSLYDGIPFLAGARSNENCVTLVCERHSGQCNLYNKTIESFICKYDIATSTEDMNPEIPFPNKAQGTIYLSKISASAKIFRLPPEFDRGMRGKHYILLDRTVRN